MLGAVHTSISLTTCLLKKRCHQTVDAGIRSRMPGGGEIHNVFTLFLLKRCTLSFVYHRSWLESNLHPKSEVRGSSIWNESVPFADHVTTKHV